MGLGEKMEFTQAASTVVWQSASFNHTCLNLHGLWFLIEIPSSWMRSGLWYEKIASKCVTDDPGKRENHSGFATALSKRSQTVIPLVSFLHQVNFIPLYPKSARQQASVERENSRPITSWHVTLSSPQNTANYKAPRIAARFCYDYSEANRNSPSVMQKPITH